MTWDDVWQRARNVPVLILRGDEALAFFALVDSGARMPICNAMIKMERTKTPPRAVIAMATIQGLELLEDDGA